MESKADTNLDNAVIGPGFKSLKGMLEVDWACAVRYDHEKRFAGFWEISESIGCSSVNLHGGVLGRDEVPESTPIPGMRCNDRRFGLDAASLSF